MIKFVTVDIPRFNFNNPQYEKKTEIGSIIKKVVTCNLCAAEHSVDRKSRSSEIFIHAKWYFIQLKKKRFSVSGWLYILTEYKTT